MLRLRSIGLCATVGACTVVCALALAIGSAQGRPADPITVMSYNIFQGTELSHSLGAQNFSQLGPAVAADYQNVIKSNIPARARALAAEIKANRPALVGLQEAVLWRTRSPAGPQPFAIPGNATHVSYDFVKLLVRALAARGVHYRAVAITNNIDIQATGDFPGNNKKDIRYTDRVAIIARRGVKVSNVQDHNYVARDAIKLIGVPIPVPDGWASVDAAVGNKHFRFITTHLDGLNTAQAPTIRAEEANELLNGPAFTSMPVILSCDCNSKANTLVHKELSNGAFHDSWAKLHPHARGLTCCHRRHPKDPETDVADPHPHQGIVERIDYVWSRSPFKVLSIATVGLNPKDRTHTKPRLWPSDHLGLVALLKLP